MTRLRVTHLLDDFNLGGVTNGLKLFNAPEFAEIAVSTTLPIDRRKSFAPTIAADVIVTHFPPNWRGLAFLASLRARNPRAQLVHVEHSYSADWERLYVADTRRFRLMLNLAFRMADRVVAVSHAQARWLLAINAVAPDKLEVIHPYTEHMGLATVPDLDLAHGDRLVVGAYGRFATAKGFDRLINAFKAAGPETNLELVLGGLGPDEGQLRAAAAGHPHIRFVGKVSDVPAFLGGCHVIAVPSRYEAYGQVANEAREAGRSILVSFAGGLPEQVGNAGLIVDCDDHAALVNALRMLRSLPLAEMGRAGRAATRADRETRIGQWLALLNRIGDQKVRRRVRPDRCQSMATGT